MIYEPLYITWHAHNETGIRLIDEQHRGIVSIINTFYYMMGKHMDNTMMYSCISDTLRNYSRTHFITEEAFMKVSDYPGLEQHIEMHRNLISEIEEIELQGIANHDARPLLEFLKRWWIEHINEKDKLYIPYLHSSNKSHFGRLVHVDPLAQQKDLPDFSSSGW